MTKTTILCCRGTGEPQGADDKPTGMLADWVSHLDADSFDFIQVVFPASIGPAGRGFVPEGVSLDTSVRVGVTNALHMARAINGPVAFAGYSLGALVVNQILFELNSYQVRGSMEVAFAFNIANPGRLPGESLADVCGQKTYGLHGKRQAGPTDIPVIELANPRDMITSSDPLSPIRRISDAISPFSAVEGFRFGDLSEQLKRQRGSQALLRFWNPAFWRRYAQALEDVYGYALERPTTEHSAYMTTMHNVLPGFGNGTWNEYAAIHINERYAHH